jgi:hypothetical protein
VDAKILVAQDPIGLNVMRRFLARDGTFEKPFTGQMINQHPETLAAVPTLDRLTRSRPIGP